MFVVLIVIYARKSRSFLFQRPLVDQSQLSPDCLVSLAPMIANPLHASFSSSNHENFITETRRLESLDSRANPGPSDAANFDRRPVKRPCEHYGVISDDFFYCSTDNSSRLTETDIDNCQVIYANDSITSHRFDASDSDQLQSIYIYIYQ